jgi:tetratricopeptide (TPR) repeat protein
MPNETDDFKSGARTCDTCWTMRLSLAIALLLSLSSMARADADALAEAKERFHRGTQLYDLGKYLEAASEYEAAFRLTERSGLLFNIGQAYRLGGQPKKALAAYQGFLRRSPEAPQRSEVEEHIAALEKQVADEDARPAAVNALAPRPSPAPVLAAPAAPAPTAESRPARTRNWVWGVTAAGVVVAGLAIGLGVGLGLPPSAPHADRTVGGF